MTWRGVEVEGVALRAVEPNVRVDIAAAEKCGDAYHSEPLNYVRALKSLLQIREINQDANWEV